MIDIPMAPRASSAPAGGTLTRGMLRAVRIGFDVGLVLVTARWLESRLDELEQDAYIRGVNATLAAEVASEQGPMMHPADVIVRVGAQGFALEELLVSGRGCSAQPFDDQPCVPLAARWEDRQ